MSILSEILDRLPASLVNRVMHWLPAVPPAHRLLSRYIINLNTEAAAARPQPFSMQVDGYTSWETLTDKQFTTRHLSSSSEAYQGRLPDSQRIVELMMRPKDGQQELAYDTSLLFPFFAQWFTDSFLRTHPSEFRKNQSNHGIDLVQIYGMNAGHTQALRASHGGRLKSQHIKGQEYGANLFEEAAEGTTACAEDKESGKEENWIVNGARVRDEFQGLFSSENFRRAFSPRFPAGSSEEDKEKIRVHHHKHLMRCFAVGLEHGNSTMGNVLMNTLFLREHNRIAKVLEKKYGDTWDNDRLFETARNINIVSILKIVVQDYVPHIAQFDFPLTVIPGEAEKKNWYRTNWIAIEFNLLYRWHGLIPDTFSLEGKTYSSNRMVTANELFLNTGIDTIVREVTRQRAGRIGLHHTPEFLREVKRKTVELSRNAKLRSYNEYREHFDLKAFTRFEQFTSNQAVVDTLKDLYNDRIDDVEYLVGLLAEGYGDARMMGQLQERMVAHDAFTHALTNPLLSKRVFNAKTFSDEGMESINATNSLADIVVRNTEALKPSEVSFHYQPHYVAPMPLIDPEVEREAKDEPASIQRCLDAVTEAMRHEYPSSRKIVRRDAHPKHHGIVRATLTISDEVPEHLQHGIFATPGARFQCWVRFSNGSPKAQPDIIKDARGMAIKVFGAQGQRATSDSALQDEVQDFVMIDHPAFFIRNPRQYAPFIRLQTRGKEARFFVGWNPLRWHLRQGWIARSLQKKKASPLENDYFSMSPYKLGPHAIKFALRSCGTRDSQIPNKPSDDYMRETMVEALRDKAATFDFTVQERTHPDRMPIEDPTVQWSESCSPYHSLARLHIDAQVFDTPAQMKFAEDISYNPWNSLMAHAPLGGLNRLRLAAYKMVSDLRHLRNGRPALRPTGNETFE